MNLGYPKATRLLIINCASPYFFYIPMGTFGLCDHLEQQNLEVSLFNPALYPEQQAVARLGQLLVEQQPTHVGFILHWQETAHGLLAALKAVKAGCPQAITLCGGFTAAYFGEDLLRAVPGLDYVVTGDPELPVAQLLQGIPPSQIPNLIHRLGQTVVRNPHTWLIEQPQLDTLSFAGLRFLIDADLYLAKCEAKLGFPLFLGRGCVFDCEYCGGSRHAFAGHSGRRLPAVRSLAAVLADLRLLVDRIRVLYICYENDPRSIKALFRAIAEDQALRGRFVLHYGAWHLLDTEFIELYRAAFACDTVMPIVEYSPEVYADALRRLIKRGATYTMAELEDNIGALSEAFARRVRIEVFFSRYHPALSASALMAEAGALVAFRHRLLRRGWKHVRVCFDHLSTDVGSRNWEEGRESPQSFARFLEDKDLLDAGDLYPFPVDNLCLHLPGDLSREWVVRFEGLLVTLDRLEHLCGELYHLLCTCLDDRWLPVLMACVGQMIAQRGVHAFFTEPPLPRLLEDMVEHLPALPSRYPCGFWADLIRYSLTKLTMAEAAPRPLRSPASDTGLLVLERRRVTIHEQNYCDLESLLKRLVISDQPLAYERTVMLFFYESILTMPHKLYRATLAYFEQPHRLADYAAHLGANPQLEPQRELKLVERMIADGLLRPYQETGSLAEADIASS